MALLDGLKMAADALRQADKIPQFEAVLDAYAQLAELQAQSHVQLAEIRQLKDELERVRTDQASAEGRKIWANLLWIPANEEPYCVHCWEKQKRLFHVNKVLSKGAGTLISHCPECSSETLQPPHQSYWEWERKRAASETASV